MGRRGRGEGTIRRRTRCTRGRTWVATGQTTLRLSTWMPVNDRLAAVLMAQRGREEAKREALGVETLSPSDHVFTAPDGQPLQGTALTKRFEKRLVAAGLPPRTWHDLRHGFASCLADAGVDLLVISRLPGHFRRGDHGHHLHPGPPSSDGGRGGKAGLSPLSSSDRAAASSPDRP